MSDYDGRIFSSDLDAFKHSGTIQTESMTISGTIAQGAEKEVFSGEFTLSGQDLNEITFDNSQKHSGKWHGLTESRTFVRETTTNTDLIFVLTTVVTGTTLKIRAWTMNPYAMSITLQSTVINFRYVPYETTFS